jgi:signal transduction histidine kinase
MEVNPPIMNSVPKDKLIESYQTYINLLEKEVKELREKVSNQSNYNYELKASYEDLNICLDLTYELFDQHTVDDIKNSFLKVVREKFSSFQIDLIDGLTGISQSNIQINEILYYVLKDDGILDWVYQNKKTIFFDLNDLVLPAEAIENHFLIICPLQTTNTKLGVLFLFRNEQTAISEHELRMLNLMSYQTSYAMENLHSLSSLEDRHAALMKNSKFTIIGEMIGGVAHEINNPLQIISGNVQLAEITKNYDVSISKIKKQTERISKIIQNLMLFARESDGKYQSERVSVNQIIEHCLNFLEHDLKKKNIDTVFKKSTDIPTLFANNDILQQCFLNLLLNAKTAMPSGGKLYIETSKDNKYLYVEIKDSGIGIPESIIDDIFNPFFTTCEGNHHKGLGLTITYNHILQYKGHIEVQSKVGETIFTVSLPYEKNRLE